MVLLATRYYGVWTTEFLRGNAKDIEEGWAIKAMREIDRMGRSGATAGEYGARRCQRRTRRRRRWR